VKYFDRDGTELTEAEYQVKNRGNHKVRHTTLMRGDCYAHLVTDWIGRDLADGKLPDPVYFGSALLHHGEYEPVALYGNLHSAKYGHKIKLMELRAQGWKHGWRAFPYMYRDTLHNPRSLGYAWYNVVFWLALAIIQLGGLALDIFTGWGLSWFKTPVNIIFGGINLWCLWHSMVGVGATVRKRAAERQAAEDKAKFETIINRSWNDDRKD